MTEPPPWNDPIKPPNGNFSLEERKWREGITRALRNMQINSLGDIGDVTITSPTANQILKFDGTNWVNGSLTSVNWGDIAGTLSDQTDLKNALDAKQDISGLAAVAFSGSYNDLTDTPTIPTDTNDLTNGAGFLNSSIFSSNNTWSGTNTISGTLIPDSDNAKYLGSATERFRDVYARIFSLSGLAQMYTPANDGKQIKFLWTNSSNTSRVVSLINDAFQPDSSNTIDLGSSNNRWKTVYTNNNVNVSDRRIKNNIIDLEDALPKLNSIVVKSYTMDKHKEGIMYGLVAQDELARNPELVVVPENYSDKGGGEELGYMPNNVLFLAVRAIQELSEKVKKLEGGYGNNTKDK